MEHLKIVSELVCLSWSGFVSWGVPSVSPDRTSGVSVSGLLLPDEISSSGSVGLQGW